MPFKINLLPVFYVQENNNRNFFQKLKENLKNGQKFLTIEADLRHSGFDIKPLFRGFSKDDSKKFI